MGLPPSTICHAGSDGGFFLPLFSNEVEETWPRWLRALLYLLGLLYAFIGVGELSDVFMESIETITSQERERTIKDERGNTVTIREKVWNGTVASLTLMALGSSAPEILLNVVEVVGNGFFAGDLGPSTIVGSAAFNFLIIIAVCIIAIPDGESRRIRSLSTFIVTTVFSLFAYSWMYIVISVWTPDVITISEAAITALCLPLLVHFAYQADIGAYGGNDVAAAEPAARDDGVPPLAGFVAESAQQTSGRRPKRESLRNTFNASTFDEAVEKDRLRAQMRVVRATHDPRGALTTQQIADIAAVDLGLVEPRSIAFYRGMSGKGTRRKFAQRRTVKKLAKALHKGAKIAHKGVRFIFPAVGYDDMILEGQREQQRAAQAKADAKAKAKAAKAGQSKALHALKMPTQRWARKKYYGEPRAEVHAPPVPAAPPAGSARDAEGALISLGATRSDEADDDLAMIAVQMSGEDGDSDSDGAPKSCGSMYVERVRAALQLWPEPDEDEDEGEEGEGEVADGGEAAKPGVLEIVLHIAAIPWKLLSALLAPPPEWMSGVPTFFASLALIGAVTAVISDLAGILGCVVGIADPVTAVTLVALGTSLPDTFASKIAAENEPTADSSITNVTGSNSVNVFIGLGLPWLLASSYWALHGPSDAWAARYPDIAARMAPGTAQYVVIGGDLGFSVSVFFVACLVGVAIIFYRRIALGAELGGTRRAKWASAGALVTLWVMFIVTVCLKFSGVF